jgi:hypothetical protein
MADRLASVARVLAMAACCAWGGAPLFAQSAVNLRVDGAIGNDHVTGSTPTFCWDYAGPQSNWHIQVDDDAGFRPTARHAGSSVPSVWFWDSGSQAKGDLAAQRCAVMRQVVRPGTVSMGLDRRIGAIHWRVRLQTASGWGPWAASTLRVNQPPLMPSALSVAADPREGSGAVSVPGGPAGTVWHVSAEKGDDAGAGDQAKPFRTLARAVAALAPGDTLLVHDGVYEENVVLPAPQGERGEPGASIVVKAAPGEAPVLRAAASGSRVALEIGAGGGPAWTVEGLTIGGAATQTGIVVSGAQGASIRDCRWEGTLAPSATGVRVEGDSRDITIAGCQFDQPMRRQVEIAGASHVALRGNEFSGFTGPAVLVRGGATGVTLEGNILRDASPADAAVELAGGTTGTRIARNVFTRLGGGSRSAALRVYRGGGLAVEHNVFHAVQGTALQVNEHAPYGIYRNNIVTASGQGLRFQGGGSSVTGSVVDFNIFSGNGADLDWGGASQALLDHAPAGNCLGGRGTACDPMFRDAAAGDFRLRDGSPARDAADPFSPVPEGGGLRADIGLHEAGSPGDRPGPQDLEPLFRVADRTPRFSWSLDDLDDRLVPPGTAAKQARFQIQIDTRPGFDGAGGRPRIDSGAVSAAAEQYVLPSAHALAPGSWYVRVRQWDGSGTVPGAWSDPPVRFIVQGQGPVDLASAVPAPGGMVSPEEAARLRAELLSRDNCLDASRVRLFVNGSEVLPEISGDAARLALEYEAPASFEPGASVSVRVVAGCAGHSGAALDTAYTFAVLGPAPAPPTGLRVGR